jgi:hypothetical protein
VNPRTGFDDVDGRKMVHLPGLELRPLGRPARGQSLYRRGFLEIYGEIKICLKSDNTRASARISRELARETSKHLRQRKNFEAKYCHT